MAENLESASAVVPAPDKAMSSTFSSSPTASVTYISLLFLAVNCAVAIYNAREDPWAVAFVAAAYADVLLLFHFLRLLEESPAEATKRRFRVKAAVWMWSATLTVMFGADVAALMPIPVAAVAWAMSSGAAGSAVPGLIGAPATPAAAAVSGAATMVAILFLFGFYLFAVLGLFHLVK